MVEEVEGRGEERGGGGGGGGGGVSMYIDAQPKVAYDI